MKRIPVLLLALFAIVAISAISVAGASGAKEKTVLKLSTSKGALAPGAKVKDFSSNLITETAAGNLECEESTIGWELSKNEAKKDEGSATEDIEAGTYEGLGCKTSLGAAKITASGFAWPIKLSDKGTGEIKGSKKVVFTSEFVGGEAKGFTCTLEAAKVKFTFNTTGPVKLTVTKQKFKAAKHSNAVCPKEGHLSGEFNMTSEGEPVEASL